MKDSKLKNGLNNNFISTPPPPPPQRAVNEALTSLFCLLAFLFLHACSSSDPSPIPPNTTTSHKVTFKSNIPSSISATVSNLPAEQNVNEGNLATEPTAPPTLDGYTFGGWYTEASTTTEFQFSTKITKATTLYAKWTPLQTFTITYRANKPSNAPPEATLTGVPENPVSISEGQTATALTPTLTGYSFVAWYTEPTTTNPFDFSQVITASIDLYAKWNIQQYTITYHGNKPQDLTANVTGLPDPVNVDYNQSTTVPTPPTLAGYNFVGWYTEATATNKFDFSQGITANIDLYAKWTRNPVVHFDTQGGNDIEPQRLTGTIKRATRPDNDPTREDYTFDNWYITADTGTTQFNFDQDITVQSTIVYARWNRIIRTITYHGNKPSDAPEDVTVTGVPENPVNISDGQTATAPATPPELQDYDFQGWYAGTITTGTPVALENTAFAFETTVIKADLLLYAKWSRTQISVSFHGRKPSTAPTDASITGLTADPTIVTVNSGETTAPIPAPELTGYTLDGWFIGTITGGTLAIQDTAFDFAQPLRGENINLYTKWLQQFTVTYHDNKPSDAPEEATVTGLPTNNPVSIFEGQTAKAPTPPTLTGYNFVAWYTEPTTTNQFDFSQGITTSIDLYAKWTQDPVVIFDTQEGSAIEPQRLTETPKRATRPDNEPTREDYTFDNWYTTAETGTTPFNFDQDITAQSTTVYARWTRKQRTITYHGNKPDTVPRGVSVTNLPDPATVNVNSGDTATAPATPPVLQDYVFQDWFAGTTTGTTPMIANTAFVFETTVIKENKDLYAKWTRKQITITFHGRKPSTAPEDASITGLTTDPTIVTVNSGETTTALKPPPELTGYMLDGWFIGTITGGTLALQDTAFDFAQPVRGENINLYTKWLQQFTVTYHGNKPSDAPEEATVTGVTTTPVTVNNGDRITPTPPTLTGYSFVAWYTEATATNQFNFSQVITANIDLYAKWTTQVFTVTYHGNKSVWATEDETVTGLPTNNPVTVNSGDRITAPNDPTLAGLNFLGWYTEEATTNPFDFSQVITANIDLYAKWTTNPIVYFDTQGGNAIERQILPGTSGRATRPDDPTRDDYVFENWYRQDVTGLEIFDFTKSISANVTLIARWNRIVRTITYHGNKPDAVPSGVSVTNLPDPVTVDVNSGDTATPPTATPELQDYVFQDWFAGTTTGTTPMIQNTAFAFETTAIKENKDLYAKWTRKEITISFYGNKPNSAPQDASITGLTTDPTIVTLNSGETTTALKPPPELTGYRLDGWYKGTASTTGTVALESTAFDFALPVRGENINLYTKWLQQFTVTYHANKPSDAPQDATVTGLPTNNPVSIFEGQTATEPNDPILTGYNFVGWYTEEATTNQFNFSQGITTSIDLYAKWSTSQTFTITYNANKPTGVIDNVIGVPTDVDVINNQRTSEPRPEPTLVGYTFEGWYTEATATNPFDFSQVITTNINLYAKWNIYFNASMAWVSMREGLVQFDNGTLGVKTIGVIVTHAADTPSYDSVKDLPGFYTRKTKADGTARTVYLSMTDKMTTSKISTSGVVTSVDGNAAGFVSAIAVAPEILHPDTDYYVHFYYIKAMTGVAIHKLMFKTENFPSMFPTATGTTYSSFYNHVATDSTSPNIEYKSSEKYLIPVRLYLPQVELWVMKIGHTYQLTIDKTSNSRPLTISSAHNIKLMFDLYNLITNGPVTNPILSDFMLRTIDLGSPTIIDSPFAGYEHIFYNGSKATLITE